MRQTKLVNWGFLLGVALCVTGCSFGADEKEPEIVPDEMIVEAYYVAGMVTDRETAEGIAGVTVRVGDKTGTTAADGMYEVAVDAKRTYSVSFAKEQYVEQDTEAVIASGASNHAVVTLSVKMSRKSAPVPVTNAGATVGDKSTVEESVAVVILPAGAVPAGTTGSVGITPVVVPATASTSTTTGNSTVSTSLGGLAVESNVPSFNEPVTLVLRNVCSPTVFFEDVTVWSSGVAATKAANGWANRGKAIPDKGSYSFSTKQLDTQYSLEVNSLCNTGSIQTEPNLVNGQSSVKVDNSGSMSAITDLKLTVLIKQGWEFTTTPAQALTAIGITGADLTSMGTTLTNIVESSEGGTAKVYTLAQEHHASISGGYILYYKNDAKFCERTYSFTVKVDGQSKTAVVKLKKYVGSQETYTNVNGNMHSGGQL